jgi:mannose-1-phosphate guanylyltransferase
MNIIKNILSVSINDAEKKRAVRDKIVKYLHEVKIVSDSNALSLFQQTIEALQKRVEQSSLIVITRDSKLNNILQQIQTSIIKLETKSNYANAARREVDETLITAKKTMQKLASNSSRNKQLRKFTINVMNKVEKKTLQIMLTKDIMIKL